MSTCHHPRCNEQHGLVDGFCAWHLEEQQSIADALAVIRSELPRWAWLRRRDITSTIREVMRYVP